MLVFWLNTTKRSEYKYIHCIRIQKRKRKQRNHKHNSTPSHTLAVGIGGFHSHLFALSGQALTLDRLAKLDKAEFQELFEFLCSNIL